LHPVAVPGDGPGQLVDHEVVVPFQLAAQGVSQEFFGEVARKVAGSFGQDLFEFPG
jgi:hypothetical protein